MTVLSWGLDCFGYFDPRGPYLHRYNLVSFLLFIRGANAGRKNRPGYLRPADYATVGEIIGQEEQISEAEAAVYARAIMRDNALQFYGTLARHQ